MSFCTQINALGLKVVNCISRFLVSFGISITKKELAVISLEDMKLISKMEIFKTPHNRKLANQIAQKQQKVHDLWQEGLVYESIDLGKEVQREIYNYSGLSNNPGYYPKIMSTFWTNMIGHFAFLGIHLEGQKKGLLPMGERHIFDGKETANHQLLNCFSNDYKITKLESMREWTELSGLWPDLERLSLVKTVQDFEHIYVLWEMIWREKRKENHEKPILKLDDEYLSFSKKYLSKLGLDPDDPIVGIHIRESDTVNHLRSQPIFSYIESIKYLTQIGFKVVRLGNPSMTKMPELPGLLDLSQNENHRNLHAYIFAKSKFFISTNSGPGSIPMLFNVPTFHTNVTSLSKNILLGNKGSIYLPKKIVGPNNSALSYSQILQSPIGYSEKNPTKNSEFKILPNSAKELIDGVKEMIQFLNTQEESGNDLEDLKIIGQLRKAYNPLGNGIISASYLDSNREWFLNA